MAGLPVSLSPKLQEKQKLSNIFLHSRINALLYSVQDVQQKSFHPHKPQLCSENHSITHNSISELFTHLYIGTHIHTSAQNPKKFLFICLKLRNSQYSISCWLLIPSPLMLIWSLFFGPLISLFPDQVSLAAPGVMLGGVMVVSVHLSPVYLLATPNLWMLKFKF